MKKTFFHYALIGVLIYSIYIFFTNEYNAGIRTILAINIIGLAMLVISLIKSWSVTENKEESDSKQKELEKAYSSIVLLQNVAAVMAFVVIPIGFVLYREVYPMIILSSFLLMLLAGAYGLNTYQRLSKTAFPEKEVLNVTKISYNNEIVEQLDGTEKSILVKRMYKAIHGLAFGLVLIEFTLMFYSVITANYQIISMILIGLLLVVITFVYSYMFTLSSN
ncbi:DUF3169 family protein [Oceanobacillus jeddahense]|uniref:DUF3169 family protein n=1 Tax=Oceanobacillus jeddahense TaxID=1462527 RepID=A0ABY5JUB0_9BACI|nr:DUF3169 family protein [Oceanobacillus jeddahense]UUI03933.1 DUF3169 family protein [Oceanobacillus jeddahense]